jgi:hypothetical protein
MGTLLCKSSVGLKLQGRVRDALIQPGASPGARRRGATHGVIDNDRQKFHSRPTLSV